jgi:hypothetical protein
VETAEDAEAAAEALAEYERDGGVAADEFFRAHAAETRAAYGSTDDAPSTGDETGTADSMRAGG